MKKLLLALIFLIPACSADAQPPLAMPFATCTVANIDTCIGGPEPGRISVVLDALNDQDCVTGGGSAMALCQHNLDGTYSPVGVLGSTPFSPPYIALDDRDSDFDVDGDDLQDAVAFCGSGFTGGAGGCTIVLPRGACLSQTTTLVIGTYSPSNRPQIGLNIIGQGQPAKDNVDNFSNGSCLQWDGADGGTMIQVRGGWNLNFKNFGLEMDPGASGGNNALIGIELAADNAVGSSIQGFHFDNIYIKGSTDVRATVGSRGIMISEPATSGQVDRGKITRSVITQVDVAIENEEQQAVAIDVYESVLAGGNQAVRVSAGNVNLYNNVVTCAFTACQVVWLEKQASESPFKTQIVDNHWESQAGLGTLTFVKMGDGYSAGRSNVGITHMVDIRNNHIQVGCTADCEVNFIDGAIDTTLNVEGNYFYKLTGGNQLVSVKVSEWSSSARPSVLNWTNNYPTMGGYAAQNWLGTVAFTSGLEIYAPRIDPDTQTAFNDLNLNTIRDLGEDASGINSYFLDLSTSADPCADGQAIIDRFNTSNQYVTMVIQGDGSIGFGNLIDRGNYRTCWMVGNPSGTKDGGKSGMLTMIFNSARLSYASTGQSEAAVMLQLGTRYNDPLGNTGWIVDSVKAQGFFQMNFTVQNHGSWPRGWVPFLPFGGSTTQTTTTVGVLTSEFVYNNLEGLEMVVNGPSGRDYDDIGYYFQQSFGTHYGGLYSQNMGTGIVIEGAQGGSTIEKYTMSANDVGIVIGNPHTPNVFTLDDGTTVNESTREMRLSGISQGNLWSQLIVFQGAKFHFQDAYFEEGTQSRDSVLLGAGLCSTTTTTICTLDSDCPGGETCDPVDGANPTVQGFHFTGPNTGLPNDRVTNDEGTVLGPGFLRNATWNPSVIVDHMAATSTPPYIHKVNPAANGIFMLNDGSGNRLNGYAWTAAPKLNYVNPSSTFNFEYQKWYLIDTFISNAGTNQTVVLGLAENNQVIDMSIPSIRFCDTGGAGELIIDPDPQGTPTRSIVFPGLSPGVGDTITSDVASTPSCVTLTPISTTQWLATDILGTWTTP